MAPKIVKNSKTVKKRLKEKYQGRNTRTGTEFSWKKIKGNIGNNKGDYYDI